MGTDDVVRLAVERRVEDGAVVFVLVGELDPHTAPQLEAQSVTADGDGPVVLDLAGVTFLDSAGVRAILEINQALDDAGRQLVIRSPSEVVGRVLEIAGLHAHLRIE